MKNYIDIYQSTEIYTVLYLDDEHMIWTKKRPYFDCMRKGDCCIVFTKGLEITDDHSQINDIFFTYVQKHPSNEARDKAYKNQVAQREMRVMSYNL